jgi:hypothetical protein
MEKITGGIRPNSRIQRNRTRHHRPGFDVCSPALIIMVFIPSFAIPQEIAFLKKYGHSLCIIIMVFIIERVVPAVLILIPVLRRCDFTPVNFILRDSKEFFRLNFSTWGANFYSPLSRRIRT